MKANELRIGNWFKFTNRSALRSTGFARVEAVSIKEGIMYTRDADTWWLTPEWIEPIPLTPEILEKCGFEDIGDDGRYFWDGYWYYENMLWFRTSAIGCLYLHQLQNLYFALTGEELNVEL